MKYLGIIATGILLPIAAMADVQVNINAHYSSQGQGYSDEGEPWFEDQNQQGANRVSFEYQWSIYGGNHVLRYRQVVFVPGSNSWTFGAWATRDGYCPPSCRLHHHHHFYPIHRGPANWSRVYVQNHPQGPHYTYVYRPYSRPGVKAYRYDYYPHRDNVRHDAYPPHRDYGRHDANPPHRDYDRHGDYHHRDNGPHDNNNQQNHQNHDANQQNDNDRNRNDYHRDWRDR